MILPTIRDHFVRCADYDIRVREGGIPGEPVILLLHGFSQNSGAFVPLFRELADTHHLLAPDMPGRGMSQWAFEPASGYRFATFAKVTTEVLEYFDVDDLAIVGTSMGGSLGTLLAATSLAGRVRNLVLNDVGTELPDGAVDAILRERLLRPEFPTFLEFRSYLVDVYQRLSNAKLSDAQWTEFCLLSCRRNDAGRYTVHHDPNIFAHFEANPGDFDVGAEFQRVKCPITALHAGQSGVLQETQIAVMHTLNPNLVVEEFPSKGHALFLAEKAEIDAVRRALTRT